MLYSPNKTDRVSLECGEHSTSHPQNTASGQTMRLRGSWSIFTSQTFDMNITYKRKQTCVWVCWALRRAEKPTDDIKTFSILLAWCRSQQLQGPTDAWETRGALRAENWCVSLENAINVRLYKNTDIYLLLKVIGFISRLEIGKNKKQKNVCIVCYENEGFLEPGSVFGVKGVPTRSAEMQVLHGASFFFCHLTHRSTSLAELHLGWERRLKPRQLEESLWAEI